MLTSFKEGEFVSEFYHFIYDVPYVIENILVIAFIKWERRLKFHQNSLQKLKLVCQKTAVSL